MNIIRRAQPSILHYLLNMNKKIQIGYKGYWFSYSKYFNIYSIHCIWNALRLNNIIYFFVIWLRIVGILISTSVSKNISVLTIQSYRIFFCWCTSIRLRSIIKKKTLAQEQFELTQSCHTFFTKFYYFAYKETQGTNIGVNMGGGGWGGNGYFTKISNQKM